jgi:K+-transporting ATPase ATPase B chain
VTWCWWKSGDLIPSDGEIIEGMASVNESAITGESAPVIREAGGDRSAVTGGTTVVSDWLVVRITADPGNTFIDRMIKLVEGAERRKTPNEIALDILLAGLTIIFLIAVVTWLALRNIRRRRWAFPVLAALLVTLIPTTIGGLLSAIGIAGMDRLIGFNVVATSGRAVEAAGDVDALLLDKTGTITFGNRMAAALISGAGVSSATWRRRRCLRQPGRRHAGRPLHPDLRARPARHYAGSARGGRGDPVHRQYPRFRPG